MESTRLLGKNVRVVEDRYHMAALCLGVFGIIMILPWNVFINATAFFGLKFAGSPFSDNFSNFFGIAKNSATLASMIFFAVYGTSKSKTSSSSSSSSSSSQVHKNFMKVLGSLLVTLVLMGSITISIPFDVKNTSLYFGYILICVALSGLGVGALQNGVFSLTPSFPYHHNLAVMSGQGISGTIVSLSQIISLVVGSEGEDNSEKAIETSAIIYFVILDVIVIISIFCYFLFTKLPVVHYYTKLDEHQQNIKEEDSDLSNQNKMVEEEENLEIEESERDSKQENHLWRLCKQLWNPALSIFLIMFVTLALFPSFTSSIESVQVNPKSRLFRDLFIPFAFLLFNVGDLIGRIIAYKWKLPSRFLLPLCVLRILFFFFFLCSNVVLRDVNGNVIETYTPVLFGNDYLYWVFQLIFAISNGYLISMALTFGPSFVEKKDQGRAGGILVMFIGFGLFTGSMFSFALRTILCRCNPFVS